MATAAERSEGDKALVELGSQLAAVTDAEIVRPGADPHGAAVTALLVADFLSQPDTLGKANLTSDDVQGLTRLARAILATVDRLGGDYLPDGRTVPSDLVERATNVRTTIVTALEKALGADEEVRKWLEAVRLGSGTVDLVYDLRTLADFCTKHAGARDASATLGAIQLARSSADALEFALRSGESTEQSKSRSTLARLWTIFGPAYERARAAGEAVATGQGRPQDFPSLALVAAHRRARRKPLSLVPPMPGPASSSSPTETASTLAATAKQPKFVAPGEPPKAEPLVPPPVPRPAPITGPVKPPTAKPPVPSRSAPVAETLDVADLEIVQTVEILRSGGPNPIASAPPNEDFSNLHVTQSVDIVRSEPPPASASGDHRRREPRQTVEIEVGISSQSNFYLGFTENLSSGGVFVATYVKRPIGSKIEVALTFPTGEELRVPGTVRWLREASADGWPGLGVQFEALSDEDEKKIRKFLSMRDPLFYDE